MAIKHTTQSTNTPSPDAGAKGLIAKNAWNEDHTIEDGTITNAMLEGSVTTSLALADSALQSGDNISDLTNDAGYLTSVTPGGSDTELQFNDAGSLGGTTGVTYAYDTVEGSARIGINAPSPSAQLHVQDPDSGAINLFYRDLFSSDSGQWTFTSGGDWAITGGRLKRTAATVSTDVAELDTDFLKAEFLADTGREMAVGDTIVVRMNVYTYTAGFVRLYLGNDFSSQSVYEAEVADTNSSRYFNFPIDVLSDGFRIEASAGWIGDLDTIFFYERTNPSIDSIRIGDNGYARIASNGNVTFGDNCNVWNDGAKNIAIGTDCLPVALGCTDNIAIGEQALFANMESDDNIAIGPDALKFYKGDGGSDGNNIAIGNALTNMVFGSDNLAVGAFAGSALDKGNENLYIGFRAGFGGLTVNNCTAIGSDASLVDGVDYQLNIGSIIYGDLTPTDKKLIIRGGTGQSQNLLEIQDSAETVLASVDNSGNITTTGTIDGRDVATDGVKLDGIESGAQVNVASKFLMPNSGRWYCYTDRRWTTDSDDLYGPSYYQFVENSGTGETPIIEWEHLGMFVPAGTKVTALNMIGRANNTQVTDMEMYVIYREPTTSGGWESGLDADGEFTSTVLHNDLFFTPTGGGTVFTGAMNDIHKRTIALDHTVGNDGGYLSIYMRPVGTLTSTRYFYSTYTWECEYV